MVGFSCYILKNYLRVSTQDISKMSIVVIWLVKPYNYVIINITILCFFWHFYMFIFRCFIYIFEQLRSEPRMFPISVYFYTQC